MRGKFGLLSPEKASSHSTALTSSLSPPPPPTLPVYSIFVLPYRRTLLRQMHMGSLTCALIWVCAVYTKGGARHKQVCTRVDSGGHKNCLWPCPARGSNPGSSGLNSDAVTTDLRPSSLHWTDEFSIITWRHVISTHEGTVLVSLVGFMHTLSVWLACMPGGVIEGDSRLCCCVSCHCLSINL